MSVTGGKVFLTESYAGAPFGLSIVNPVKTGPFDLEHDTSPADPGYTPACDCVVVRAKIEVNPSTAELTITTDRSGPHSIPSIIDGIPVQIQKVNVTVNRERFTFNPTSCNPLEHDRHDRGRRRRLQPGRGPLPGPRLREPALHADAGRLDRRKGEQSRTGQAFTSRSPTPKGRWAASRG